MNEESRENQSISESLRRRLRESVESGVSMYSIARECKVDYASIHRWLNGESQSIRSDTLDKLAAYLGLTLVPIANIPAAVDAPNAKGPAGRVKKATTRKAAKKTAGQSRPAKRTEGGDSPGSRGTRG